MTTPDATTTTTLTARTPEDLVAAAAVVLGFWPTDSAVMLTFDGRHRFHARVDLPDSPDDADELAELAACLVRPAAHHGVGRVVLLLYSADAALARACWQALGTAFGRQGIVVLDAVRVTDSRWFPLVGRDRATREAGVVFGAETRGAHPFLAQAVLDGRVTHRSRDALAATLEPDVAAVAAIDALARRGRGDPDAATELAEGTWARAVIARHLDAATLCSDAEAARLLVGMRSLRVRDAAWSAISRERSRVAMGFFGDLSRRSPADLLPAAAALLGWSAWQGGDGALAWCAIDRCRGVDPAYSLADLLAEALERAVPPTAWHEEFDWKEGLDTA